MPSNSRPHTPPSLSRSTTRNPSTPPPSFNPALSLPPKRPTYPQFVSQTNSDWGAGHDDYDEDEGDTERFFYSENADEDEFGLPSISSMRREAKKRIPNKKTIDPGGSSGKGSNGMGSMLTPERLPARARANSSDIAEERGAPVYPTAKQSEGKILRPQYKDILRGSSSLVIDLRIH